jgi:hypothetical protein
MTEGNDTEIQEIHGNPDNPIIILDQLDGLDYAVNFALSRSRLVPLLVPFFVSTRSESFRKIPRT